MRKSVREEYLDGLQRAADDLPAIENRFHQYGDLVRTRYDLNRWKEATEAIIEKYGSPGDRRAFRAHVDFDILGRTGGYVTKGIEKYESFLSESIKGLAASDIKRGYPQALQGPLEQIDELSERLDDMRQRQMTPQRGAEEVSRWKDEAYRTLAKIVGVDRAGEIRTIWAAREEPENTFESEVKTYVEYLVDLKEDIQKYPHHLVSIGGTHEGAVPAATAHSMSYVDETRLRELRAIGKDRFDLSRLIRLCEELNIDWQHGAYHSVAMLVRAVMDHVPPIFGVSSFGQIANNYAGSRSFKEAMGGLEAAARRIGDAHLHTQIRDREVLPNGTQVNHASQLDVLLAEIVRLLSVR